METKKINQLADSLLDMSKSNNLINFKNTKLGTVEVIYPDFYTIFNNAEHMSEFIVYDPKFETDFDEVDEDSEQCESEVTVQADVKHTKEEYCSLFGDYLKKNQIMIYNLNNKPFDALKNICKKGKTSIEETGVNIIYMAFGFINWSENNNSKIIMKSPILLMPISIENESVIEPYHIKISFDELTINQTFSYKLQNEYGIKLPEFDDDISLYFNEVEEIIKKLNWSISYECSIGTFSFLKNNMYQDLKNNANIIANNKNICMMMGEIVDESSQSYSSSEQNQNEIIAEQHNVVDSDSSQSEAIEMAKNGKSFVLQGPPGTGKSQTITNIIAEFLADGKSVLFVSEKLAALQVVYDKLKKVGLDEFCLELHSHKSNKKQVIDELCQTLKKQKSVLSKRAYAEIEAKKNAQKKLDDYTEELHKMRPVINKTLYQLYNEVSACRKAPNIDYVINNIKDKGETFIKKIEPIFRKYVEYIPSIGYDYRKNIWYGLNIIDMNYQIKLQLKENLCKVKDLCKSLKTISNNIYQTYNIKCDSLNKFGLYQNFFQFIKNSTYISPKILQEKDLSIIIEYVETINELKKNIILNRTNLDKIYDAEIYATNGNDLYKKLTRQFYKPLSRIFSKEYKKIIKDLRLLQKETKKRNYKDIVESIESLRTYQKNLYLYDEISTKTFSALGMNYEGFDTDFDKLNKELQKQKEINEYSIEYGFLTNLTFEEFINQQGIFKSFDDSIENAFIISEKSELTLAKQFNEGYDFNNINLNDLLNKCELCIADIENVDNWLIFSSLLRELKMLEMNGLLNKIIDNGVESELIVSAMKKTLYSQWIDTILYETPILLELSRVSHDEIVKCFKEKDELNFEINRAIIKENLARKRPNLDMIASGSAVSILLREGEKKRKQKNIRQLLEETSDLILNIKPCFLMSPLSVSTFLSPNIKFDVIIFDEASQIFPQDAIGAIYRGNQLIVVGDSKQMPPTNFFNVSNDVDDDSEENLNDYESILDICSVYLSQCRLKWHYRSKYEQLIMFSNKEFYDNELITFPSTKVNGKGVGVDYYYVNGIFDHKSKTNREEAERVVELVFENFEKFPERSLGVVAFSVSQQTLIEKLLYKRRKIDTSKEQFFNSKQNEPFFVKNLETVQGDERDTIIFSTAYGKDVQGRLVHNFGPINRSGGERRLNVAVTRAKYNIQLVSSMHYNDIDLSRTQSVGTRLLREYLDFAENGNIALNRQIKVSEFEQFDSEFELEVCEFLKSNGYSVDTQVGCSSFKIDLALKEPNSSNYLLAIECDGASYHSSKTARDRDRLRQSILENMGWKFYRIWSTDWFKNKNTEKKRLLDAVKNAVENISYLDNINSEKVIFEENAAYEFKFPEYVKVDIPYIERKHFYRILPIVREVLEIESPLSEEWLVKRLAHLYGREKVTTFVTRQFNDDMINCKNYGIIRKNGFLYLNDKDIAMLRVPKVGDKPRDIKYISLEELSLGIKEILKQNVTVEKNGLFRLLAQQLGFTRTGDAINDRLENALALLENEIKIEGNILSYKNS